MVNSPQFHLKSLDIIKKKLREDTITKWQQRWDSSSKRRHTHTCLDNIRNRLESCRTFNRDTTRILSGHARTNEYMNKIGKRDNKNCEWCGAETQTIDHLLFHCEERRHIQEPLRNRTREEGMDWPPAKEILTKKMYEDFSTLCTELLNQLEDVRQERQD